MSELEKKLEAVSESVNDLNSRVSALEENTNGGESKALSIDTVEFPKVCGVPMVTFGSGVPTAVPDYAGQFYIDSTNERLYVAVAVTNATKWKLVSFS